MKPDNSMVLYHWLNNVSIGGKTCGSNEICKEGTCTVYHQCDTPSLSCSGPYNHCTNGLICVEHLSGQRICVSGGDYIACAVDSDCRGGLVCLSKPNQDCRTEPPSKPGTCGYYAGVLPRKRDTGSVSEHWGLPPFWKDWMSKAKTNFSPMKKT